MWPQDRCAALQALASQLHTARGDLQSAMGGLVQHLDVLSRAPDPCRAWLAMLGQLTHQAASGQLPEGHHFLRTLAAVAREAVGKDEEGFAAGLACLMASSCASAGDLGQVHTDAGLARPLASSVRAAAWPCACCAALRACGFAWYPCSVQC